MAIQSFDTRDMARTGISDGCRALLRQAALSLCLVGSFAASNALAVPASDCPRAGERFSLNTPIFDIMANAKAASVVDRVAPGFLQSVPPIMQAKSLPALSAILPLRFLAATLGSKTQELDKALAAIPIEPADDALLCARYEDGPAPTLPTVGKRPALLVFDKSTGFRDEPSVDAAAAALKDMARKEGWQLVFTSSAAAFNKRDLAKFDAVFWNNVSGDVLSLGQRAAFQDYVERGGSFVGVHGSGGDPITFWPWYVDTLIGARFSGHPFAPQFQSGRLRVEDENSSITAGLGQGWDMVEEWYSFRSSPRERGSHILVTLDENSYEPVGFEGSLRMGDHPITWTRCVGAGRSFYSAIGHLPASYTHKQAARLLRQGIDWAMRRKGKSCSPG